MFNGDIVVWTNGIDCVLLDLNKRTRTNNTIGGKAECGLKCAHGRNGSITKLAVGTPAAIPLLIEHNLNAGYGIAYGFHIVPKISVARSYLFQCNGTIIANTFVSLQKCQRCLIHYAIGCYAVFCLECDYGIFCSSAELAIGGTISETGIVQLSLHELHSVAGCICGIVRKGFSSRTDVIESYTVIGADDRDTFQLCKCGPSHHTIRRQTVCGLKCFDLGTCAAAKFAVRSSTVIACLIKQSLHIVHGSIVGVCSIAF